MSFEWRERVNITVLRLGWAIPFSSSVNFCWLPLPEDVSRRCRRCVCPQNREKAEVNAVCHVELVLSIYSSPSEELLIFPSSHDHSGCPSLPETLRQRALETHTHTLACSVWSLKKDVSSLVELEGRSLPAAAQSWPPVAVSPAVWNTALPHTSFNNQQVAQLIEISTQTFSAWTGTKRKLHSN